MDQDHTRGNESGHPRGPSRLRGLVRPASALPLGMAIACLIALSACDRTASNAPETASLVEKVGRSSAASDDALITTLVKAALVAHQDINGKAISVSTRRGQVTLSGSIPASQIARAEQIARAVDGVRTVDNRLRPTGILA